MASISHPQFSAAACPPAPRERHRLERFSSWAGGLCRKSKNVFNCFFLCTQKGLWLIIQQVFCHPGSESNICHLFKAHQFTGNLVLSTLWFHVSIQTTFSTSAVYKNRGEKNGNYFFNLFLLLEQMCCQNDFSTAESLRIQTSLLHSDSSVLGQLYIM